VRQEALGAALARALAHDAKTRTARGDRAKIERRYAMLTAREREVLLEIVAGKLNKQAARALGIAERTIKLHRARVLEKMGAGSVADLVRMAELLGLGPDAR
jgi:FixJ family two-component response regulator